MEETFAQEGAIVVAGAYYAAKNRGILNKSKILEEIDLGLSPLEKDENMHSCLIHFGQELYANELVTLSRNGGLQKADVTVRWIAVYVHTFFFCTFNSYYFIVQLQFCKVLKA